ANKWLLAAVAGGLVVLAGVETLRCATSRSPPADRLPAQWATSVASAPPAPAIPPPVAAPGEPLERRPLEGTSRSAQVSSRRPHPGPRRHDAGVRNHDPRATSRQAARGAVPSCGEAAASPRRLIDCPPRALLSRLRAALAVPSPRAGVAVAVGLRSSRGRKVEA